FLFMYGYRLEATQADATVAMLAVAAGEIDEPTLAAWIRQHCAKRATSKK
ncbi:MAG: type II toxin-antitoxin system death-on-curing family toxin, partial [Rhodocyclaceae bacterium]|nr:type II toxin-antitoxin system death-on-curing family toxin [Rhodocyclaceae bacterium]